MRIAVIKKRQDFLRVQRSGLMWKKPLILVAWAPRGQQSPRRETSPPQDKPQAPAPTTPRVGFTVSKKIGKAVVRNKIKRRLRCITQAHLSHHCRNRATPLPLDFVFIATPKTAQAPFLPLQKEVKEAIDSIVNRQ